MTFDPDLDPVQEQQLSASSRLGQQVRGQVTEQGLFVVVFTFQLELHAAQDVVVYDQNSSGPDHLSSESFLSVVLLKLERSFTTVHLLSGESRPGSLALASHPRF